MTFSFPRERSSQCADSASAVRSPQHVARPSLAIAREEELSCGHARPQLYGMMPICSPKVAVPIYTPTRFSNLSIMPSCCLILLSIPYNL